MWATRRRMFLNRIKPPQIPNASLGINEVTKPVVFRQTQVYKTSGNTIVSNNQPLQTYVNSNTRSYYIGRVVYND